MNKILQDFIKQVSEQKTKILDDFARAYLAGRLDEKGFDPSRMKLLEQIFPDGRVEMWFEQQRGRSKKKK